MHFTTTATYILSTLAVVQLAGARLTPRSPAARSGQVDNGHLRLLTKKSDSGLAGGNSHSNHRRHHRKRSSCAASSGAATSGNNSTTASTNEDWWQKSSSASRGSSATASVVASAVNTRASSSAAAYSAKTTAAATAAASSSSAGSATTSASSSSSSTAATGGAVSDADSALGAITGFSGTNTGYGSWFRTDNSADSTNGESWCQTKYQDTWMGFAPSVDTMLSNFGDSTAEAAKAYCGREVKATNPNNGNTALIYIVDGFASEWVLTPGSVDLTLAAFKALYGSETSDKDIVIDNLEWEFTGNYMPEYSYEGAQ